MSENYFHFFAHPKEVRCGDTHFLWQFMPHDVFDTTLKDTTKFRFSYRETIWNIFPPWHFVRAGMMDGRDISILTWNMNHWNWHLLTCSHVKSIKGPLSLNRQLEAHKYDIEAPMTNFEAGTEHWNKTNTANLHISCIIKTSVQRTGEKVISK